MAQNGNLTIRRVPITELHQDPSNARQHDERNIAAIQSSLKTFGQVEPLVVQKGTGRIIGGNGRLEAVKNLGQNEVDVVEVECNDMTATALGIALNRTSELASWDGEVLTKHLEALMNDVDFDHLVAGFDDEEIRRLIETEINSDIVTDPSAEWEGMPEFSHEDQTSIQRVIIHFKTREDVAEFAKLLGQTVTEKTQSLWFPETDFESVDGRRYSEAENSA